MTNSYSLRALIQAHQGGLLLAGLLSMVVDQGQIIQRSKHDELLVQEGLYQRFLAERARAKGWQIGNVVTSLAGNDR
ncbi:MAG: hypothetical protein KF832_28880 [Caldilineaceae bacterium]|nr:hypothetical protein [Caldilineaceae bacterium]